jgi:hypothetical protein
MLVKTSAGSHVRLVTPDGEVVMNSRVYDDVRDAERVMEIVGEAVQRVLLVDPEATAELKLKEREVREARVHDLPLDYTQLEASALRAGAVTPGTIRANAINREPDIEEVD